MRHRDWKLRGGVNERRVAIRRRRRGKKEKKEGDK
jgi:hypothetical protein